MTYEAKVTAEVNQIEVLRVIVERLQATTDAHRAESAQRGEETAKWRKILEAKVDSHEARIVALERHRSECRDSVDRANDTALEAMKAVTTLTDETRATMEAVARHVGDASTATADKLDKLVAARNSEQQELCVQTDMLRKLTTWKDSRAFWRAVTYGAFVGSAIMAGIIKLFGSALTDLAKGLLQ